jgi:hypothetical protein
MKSARFLAAVAIFVSLVLTNLAYAVLVDDIQGTLGQTQWYFGSTDTFQTKSMGGNAADIEMLEFSTVNSTGTEYVMFAGSTFSITPSALIGDQTSSNSGRAKGIFASGATLTISGDLYRNDESFELVASGDLIVAQIMTTWQLEEMVANPYPINTVRGHAYFSVIGGLLADGASNLDGLVLNDFSLNFTFERCTPEVTDFATNAAAYTCNTPKVQFGPVPEPASVMLMGMGDLAIFRKSEKK